MEDFTLSASDSSPPSFAIPYSACEHRMHTSLIRAHVVFFFVRPLSRRQLTLQH
jgi:hypothetical protein